MKLPKIALLILLAVFTAGCESGNEFPSVERNAVDPLPASMKGYELYSWSKGSNHYYTLITGTNRLKPRAEIVSDQNIEEEEIHGGFVKYTTSNRDDLISTLSRLPEGQFVSWGPRKGFSFPFPTAVVEIRQACKKLNLQLAVYY